MTYILTILLISFLSTAFYAKWYDKFLAMLGCTGGSMVILIILIFVL